MFKKVKYLRGHIEREFIKVVEHRERGVLGPLPDCYITLKGYKFAFFLRDKKSLSADSPVIDCPEGRASEVMGHS